jgi:hypothetical protein
VANRLEQFLPAGWVVFCGDLHPGLFGDFAASGAGRRRAGRRGVGVDAADAARRAAEAGIHAHYQDVVNQGKNLVESVDGSGGIYDDSGLASVRGD